jgi:rabenosyn-5
MEENEIRQGFICPLCMEDLGELEKLHQHVDNVHSAEETKDTINLIKGIFI